MRVDVDADVDVTVVVVVDVTLTPAPLHRLLHICTPMSTYPHIMATNVSVMGSACMEHTSIADMCMCA